MYEDYDPVNEPRELAWERERLWNLLQKHEVQIRAAVHRYLNLLSGVLQNYTPPDVHRQGKAEFLADCKRARLALQDSIGQDLDDFRRLLMAFLEKASQPVEPPKPRTHRADDISDPQVPF